jgi:hypothetical protein
MAVFVLQKQRRTRIGKVVTVLAAAALGVLWAGTAGANEHAEDALTGTPFAAGANAAARGQLERGGAVRRTSANGTLTGEDRAALSALGLRRMHSAAVALHWIPKTNPQRQIERLRTLARSVEAFGPSGTCDSIKVEGVGRGVCSGSVDGPIGRVRVRIPVAVELVERESAMRVLIRNLRPLEAKGLFSWRELVASNHMKVVVDLYPTEDGWYVYTRIGVEMSDHESSAHKISDTLLNLDSWLVRELART